MNKWLGRKSAEGDVNGKSWWAETTIGMRMVAIAAILLYAAVITVNAWLSDDAYITYRTVDNFIHGYGLTWNVDERVQTYTHPLWMFLISFGYWITHEIYFTAIAISLAISIAAVCILAFKVAKTAWSAVIVVIVLAFSKSFVDYSTSGLENPLTHLILALFVWVYMSEDLPKRKQLLILALLAGLATFNRMDILFMLAPAVCTVLYRHRSAKSLVLVFLGFSPFIVWEIFSLFYYGFPAPNTAYAKLNTHIPMLDLMRQGLRYFANSFRMDPLTLSVVAVGLMGVFLARRTWAVPLALGVVLYLGYVVWIGGDFMSGRFFTAPLFCMVLIASMFELRVSISRLAFLLGSILAIGVLSPFSTVLGGSTRDLSRIGLMDSSGICDERRWYCPVSGLSRVGDQGSYGSHWSSVTVKRDNPKSVAILSSIGYYGFLEGANVHIVDVLALGDPLLARMPSLWRPSWRIGHFGREIPDGYLKTLETGANSIADPALAAFYDHLSTVTRGNLLSWERLKLVIDMNLGKYDNLVDISRYQRSPYAHSGLLRFDDLSGRKQESTAWNEAGAFVMNEEGVKVDFAASHASNLLEISLDSGDRYEVAFLCQGEFVTRYPVGPTKGGGLTSYFVPVPDKALSRGFDALRVRPLEGDGRYSIGHMRFLQQDTSVFPGVSVPAPLFGEAMPVEVNMFQHTSIPVPKGLQVEFQAPINAALARFRIRGARQFRVAYVRKGIVLAEQIVPVCDGGASEQVIRVPRGVAALGFDAFRVIPTVEEHDAVLSDLAFRLSSDLEPLRRQRSFPVREVKYEDVCTPKLEGTSWDDQTHVLDERGLRVILDSLQRDQIVELSLDHDDEYQIVFFGDGEYLESISIKPRIASKGGLRVERVQLSKASAGKGYDAINIYPVSGDGRYSIGHIRLMSAVQ